MSCAHHNVRVVEWSPHSATGSLECDECGAWSDFEAGIFFDEPGWNACPGCGYSLGAHPDMCDSCAEYVNG